MDELQKQLNGRGLRISALPEKGRCLFTTRDFSAGEVIINEYPYVSVPNKNKESTESKCELCFSSSKLKKCSACGVVYYCSSNCQKLDWRLHSLECRALSKLSKDRVKLITPSIRLMVRLCIRRKLEIAKIYPSTASESYKNVETLVSHISDVDEKQLVLYAQMANLVNLILQGPEFEINIKEIAENFSKLACNAHTICDVELRPLGTGLYPVISIINHSCSPNSVLVFEGRFAVVRAMKHIPKDTEVSISYIEIAGSTVTRQKALKEQYFFTCSCPCCVNLGQPGDVQESAILEGYRCKDSSCNGVLTRESGNQGFMCQRCGLLRGIEEIKSMTNELTQITEKAATLLSSSNKTEASVAYKVVETFQLELYHPYSINLMRTRETLLKLCMPFVSFRYFTAFVGETLHYMEIFMELQDWKQALSYCKLTIPVYERVYPRSHPLLGLQYYTCGKLEWFLGETEAAVRSLIKAWDVLQITHGTTTPFVIELLGQLEEARAEACHILRSQN